MFVQGESYIEYYGYNDKWYSFVLTLDGIHVSRLSASISQDIASFRALIEKNDLAATKLVAHNLYNALIEPVSPYLTTKNITIVPHGTLHYLPFSALYDGKHYMVDRFNIRVLPSASVLEYLSDQKQKSHNLLAIGNPDLGQKDLALPYAETEVKKISGMFLGGILAGAIIGSVTALLLAPQKGSETRDQLKAKLNELEIEMNKTKDKLKVSWDCGNTR